MHAVGLHFTAVRAIRVLPAVPARCPDRGGGRRAVVPLGPPARPSTDTGLPGQYLDDRHHDGVRARRRRCTATLGMSASAYDMTTTMPARARAGISRSPAA